MHSEPITIITIITINTYYPVGIVGFWNHLI